MRLFVIFCLFFSAAHAQSAIKVECLSMNLPQRLEVTFNLSNRTFNGFLIVKMGNEETRIPQMGRIYSIVRDKIWAETDIIPMGEEAPARVTYLYSTNDNSLNYAFSNYSFENLGISSGKYICAQR